MAVAASDLIGELIAQSPQGKVLESKFKGLADIALGEAKTGRLHLRRHPLHARDQQRRERERRQPRLRRPRRLRRRRRARRRPRRRRRRTRRRRFGGLAAAAADGPRPRRGRLRRARHPQRRLGLREQPDRHRGRDQAHHAHRDRGRQGERDREEGRREARAGAGLPPSTGRRRSTKDPDDGLAGREAGAACRRSSTSSSKNKDVTQRQRLGAARARVEVLRIERRLVHRAGDLRRRRRHFTVTAPRTAT